jgi:GTP-binding protein
VAVIAHVDHGKTTLMDRLLRQCGADIPHERAMDNISLERERGITISSKVTLSYSHGSCLRSGVRNSC